MAQSQVVGDPDIQSNYNRKDGASSMKIAKWFYNADAVREANAKYKTRIAEINAARDSKLAVIEAEKIAAKAALQEKLAKNTEELKAVWQR